MYMYIYIYIHIIVLPSLAVTYNTQATHVYVCACTFCMSR